MRSRRHLSVLTLSHRGVMNLTLGDSCFFTFSTLELPPSLHSFSEFVFLDDSHMIFAKLNLELFTNVNWSSWHTIQSYPIEAVDPAALHPQDSLNPPRRCHGQHLNPSPG